MTLMLDLHRGNIRQTRFRSSRAFAPRVIVTDKLKSYAAAKKELLPDVEHRQHKRLNNRAENSHQLTRFREKKMRHLQSAGQAQKLLAASKLIYQHSQANRHQLPASAEALWSSECTLGGRLLALVYLHKAKNTIVSSRRETHGKTTHYC